MVDPGKKREGAQRCPFERRKDERLGVVGRQRRHVQTRISLANLPCGARQVFTRDVDGHVLRGIVERIQEERRLGAGATSQLHHAASVAHTLRHLARVALQDPDLGASRVVLRELADSVEQERPNFVIEELGRQCFSRGRQPAKDLRQERLLIVLRGLRTALQSERGKVRHRSLPRRMPVICQRALGGKKFL